MRTLGRIMIHALLSSSPSLRDEQTTTLIPYSAAFLRKIAATIFWLVVWWLDLFHTVHLIQAMIHDPGSARRAVSVAFSVECGGGRSTEHSTQTQKPPNSRS
jgi:hypothetical protein